MRIIKRTGGVVGLVLLTMGLTFQPVFAEQTDQLERQMTRLQSDMNVLQKDMIAIESEDDLDRRRTMLVQHMQDMHKAMAVMQKELMPPIKTRRHFHKRTNIVANRSRSDAWDSPAHIEKMDQMMAHMESMMNQMSRHRKARDVRSSD